MLKKHKKAVEFSTAFAFFYKFKVHHLKALNKVC